MATLDIRGKTHIGRRDLNEDRFVADAHWGIALVADGMGGLAAGEIAASIVASHMVDLLDQDIELREAVVRTHQAVQQAGGEGQGKPGMGATLVLAQMTEVNYRITWIGDSRAYLWNGALQQLTRDHSHVQTLLDSGQITVDQARRHPQKHLITRAMGIDKLAAHEVPLITGALAANEQLLLCSDGLTDVLTPEAIGTIMSDYRDPADQLDELISASVAGGGRDNITVVLVTARDTVA